MNKLGSRIRKLRKEKGITLSNLAEQACLSTSMLSMVERDITPPSIESLRRIAASLNVPCFYFLIEDQYTERMIVRRGERSLLQLSDHNGSYELLSPSLRKRIEMILFKLQPGESTVEEPMSHEGEECLFVLSGRLKVVLPEQHVILEEGDSLYLDQELPHKIINVGSTTAKAVSAISPPSF
jgi:transcriptional regulator with XRE-family HTH domain